MNVLNKFTIRNLKLNKKRTIVTIIGIVLSTALICAVAGVFASFQQTLINYTIQSNGDYHALFEEVKKDKQKYVMENRDVQSYMVTQNIGYAYLEGGKNEYKPYLSLMEFDKTALNSLGLRLVEGRMPTNANEIVISKHIETNGGIKYKVGDTLTLDIGQRKLSDGSTLYQSNPYYEENDEEEHLELQNTRKFTIVGIIERPNYDIEGYSAPGYTVITLLENIGENANIYVKYVDINKTYDNTNEIVKVLGKEVKYSNNNELLRWYGVSSNNETRDMLYSLLAIVLGIIVVSSVFVIRNSFAISITEKMRQYGMLASIGSTKKQIRKNVLFEGFVLGVIAIPIGILFGILATFILINLTKVILNGTEIIGDVKFVFSIPWQAILLSTILAGITIFLSSIFSAIKASRITPIEAIRSNKDIKIKSKKLKTPKFITKIFGIGGEIAYKNLKRNKKKYRTTVISLVVSITVFIALFSFMYYAFGISGDYYKEMDYNITVYDYSNKQDQKGKYEQYLDITNLSYVNESSIQRMIDIKTDLSDKFSEMEKKVRKLREEESKEKEDSIQYIQLIAVGKEEYNRFLKKANLKYDECKDKAIFLKRDVGYYTTEDKKNIEYNVLEIKQGDKIEGKITNSKNEQDIEIEIAAVTDKTPMGLSNIYTYYGFFIVSDEFIEKYDYRTSAFYINSSEPLKVCDEIDKNYPDLNYYNAEKEQREMKQIVLLISIFLYGFITVISLIGVTNVFNTITTNMNLRSKEFANLKSIGMTKKEFNKMINLESIFYGVKSLIIGIILGTGLSYWIYNIAKGSSMSADPFRWPIEAILISTVFIMIIVGLIMRYSLNKINKQNIIETIRKDNI